jgi:hypothetical protein
MPPALRHTAGCPSGQRERSVKPSAQPTLVRTQHLPPPAKTARWLRKRDPAGRFLLVTSCISACHYGSMRGSVRVHMVYSVRAKLAVRITARFAGPRPFCPVTGPPTAAHSGRPVLRCPLAPGGGLALLVPEAGAGWPDRARAISWRLHGGDDRVCVAGHRDGRPAGRRGERRCARAWMPRRAAASCSKGFPMFPVRDWIRRSPLATSRCGKDRPLPRIGRVSRAEAARPRAAASGDAAREEPAPCPVCGSFGGKHLPLEAINDPFWPGRRGRS